MKETALDRMLYALVTRGLDRTTVAGYAKAVEKQEADAAAKAFQSIDAKATGLLTHVSMMIAGLGLVAPLVAQSDIELGIIIVEMAVYLLLAVGCLRCLSVFAGRDLAGAGHGGAPGPRTLDPPRASVVMQSRHHHRDRHRVRAVAASVPLAPPK